MSPEDVYRTAGELSGYPSSAVEAFAEDSLISADEQDRIQSEAGLPTGHAFFSLSSDQWQNELVVMKRWYVLLQCYGLS